MRIALIAPIVTPIAQPFLGGSQAMVAQLAQGLQQRGHEVTLFARQGSAVPGIKIEELVVPDSVVPARFSGPSQERLADPGFFAQANIFLDLFLHLRQRQHEFDLVHAHAFDWPAFTLSALLTAIPVIHTIHLPAVTPEINEALHLLHLQGHPLRLITVSQACARTYEPYTPLTTLSIMASIPTLFISHHILSQTRRCSSPGASLPRKGLRRHWRSLNARTLRHATRG